MGPAGDLLHEDEELLAEVRPHPVVVLGPVLLLAVAVAGAATIAIRYPGAPVVVAWLLAAMIVLPALWVLARLLRWRSVRFLVTTSRLLYRRGVIGRDVVQLRFQRVAEVHCSQSVGGRLIGCGRLVFEVAGGDEPLVVDDVRRPRRLQRVITAQLDRFDLPYGPYGAQASYGGAQGPYDAYRPSAGPPWPMAAPGPPTAPAPRRAERSGRPQSWTDTPPHGTLFGDDETGGTGRARSRSATAGAGGTAGTGGTSIPGQILELDQLRRRGILSEDEFAAKKAELLGRL